MDQNEENKSLSPARLLALFSYYLLFVNRIQENHPPNTHQSYVQRPTTTF